MLKNWGSPDLLPPLNLGSLFLVCNIISTQSEEESKRQNRGLDGYRSFRPKKFSHQKKCPTQNQFFFQTNFVFRLKFFPTTKKKFRPKKNLIKIFPTKIFFRLKFFQTKFFFPMKIFLRPKEFSEQNFSQGKTFFRPTNFSDHNFFSNQKLFRSKNFLNKIFF